MCKKQSVVTSLLILIALSLAFAACGPGGGIPRQATPTAVNTAVSDTVVERGETTPQPEAAGTAALDAASGFDCTGVNQIPIAECAALVALYNSSNGTNWADNSGWQVTNTPCTWSGLDCTDGHISQINLIYNELTGTLPPELGDLSHLSALGLWGNQLHGPIPAELGKLSELGFLDLSGNLLTGSPPAELGELKKLRVLSLAHNQFGGPIPSAWGKVASLESLDLSYNRFDGPVPAELGDLVHLTQLRLSHNQLNGAIPDTLGNLSQLYELDLSYNQLSGPIPESVTHVDQCILWGNQLEGTITTDGQAPFTGSYMGVHFSADPSLATSIWPEVKPATPLPDVLDGPSYWLAMPEHIRFTFADPDLPLERRRMGFSLATEAQILVFPMAELAEINPMTQTQIETLRSLLAERGTIPPGELPLLPLTNSAQVFHTQAQYLEFGNIQGLRFISQHSQDPHPIMLSQELFYTFQGFTDDDAYYVAAFFPLTTDVLPDTIEVKDWDAFHANYDTYLSETTAVLDQLPPAEFTPDLALLDAMIMSIQLEPDRALPDTDAGKAIDESSAADCPEAVAGARQLIDADRGICFLYPDNFEVFEYGDGLGYTMYIPSLVGNHKSPVIWLTFEPADGRSLEEVTTQRLTDYAFPGTQSQAMTLGTEPSSILDNLPGQDTQRRIVAIHDDLVVDIVIDHIGKNYGAAGEQAEAAYSMIIGSFKFVSSEP